MKFDPLFKSENNKLVRLSDGKTFELEGVKIFSAQNIGDASIADCDVFAVRVDWDSVDLKDGSYNEELLASLRDFLKTAEESQKFAFIIPESGKKLDDPDEADSFIKAMVHTARRIKDCTSVIGFALPESFLEKDGETASQGGESKFGVNSWTTWFVSEMNVKHSHYLYFASESALQRFQLSADFAKTDYVLYKM